MVFVPATGDPVALNVGHAKNMIPMTLPESSEAIEIVKDRLYWVCSQALPIADDNVHYFSIDRELVYEAFAYDFGPLHLGHVVKYFLGLKKKMDDPQLANQKIVHFCGVEPTQFRPNRAPTGCEVCNPSYHPPRLNGYYTKAPKVCDYCSYRANSAFLMGCFQMFAMGKTAEEAWAPFARLESLGAGKRFKPFRDATSQVNSVFDCYVLDCLRGLETATKLGWFDPFTFKTDVYEFYERVENGDLNWIIPNKFIAFAGPHDVADIDGYPTFRPADYVNAFQKANVRHVIRLNKPQYKASGFTKAGISHSDLIFPDGSCPPEAIIRQFLEICENDPGAVAVHCKAGLGRTGTLIGLYAMKNFRFPARAWIGWNRICRPGSMLGPQQQFLCNKEKEFHKMYDYQQQSNGEARTGAADNPNFYVEDKKQAERLNMAKRNNQVGGAANQPINRSYPRYRSLQSEQSNGYKQPKFHSLTSSSGSGSCGSNSGESNASTTSSLSGASNFFLGKFLGTSTTTGEIEPANYGFDNGSYGPGMTRVQAEEALPSVFGTPQVHTVALGDNGMVLTKQSPGPNFFEKYHAQGVQMPNFYERHPKKTHIDKNGLSAVLDGTSAQKLNKWAVSQYY